MRLCSIKGYVWSNRVHYELCGACVKEKDIQMEVMGVSSILTDDSLESHKHTHIKSSSHTPITMPIICTHEVHMVKSPLEVSDKWDLRLKRALSWSDCSQHTLNDSHTIMVIILSFIMDTCSNLNHEYIPFHPIKNIEEDIHHTDWHCKSVLKI